MITAAAPASLLEKKSMTCCVLFCTGDVDALAAGALLAGSEGLFGSIRSARNGETEECHVTPCSAHPTDLDAVKIMHTFSQGSCLVPSRVSSRLSFTPLMSLTGVRTGISRCMGVCEFGSMGMNLPHFLILPLLSSD